MKHFLVTHIYDRDPLMSDDSSEGFGVYQLWINTTTGQRFECKNNTVGNAIWELIEYGGGGGAETTIVAELAWDGTSFAIPLTTASLFKRTINNGVTTLTFSLLFADDSASKSRQITVIADNSANASAISSIVFNGGTWNWDVGVLPSGLAAGAVATLELYNESDSAVKPNWTVKA